MMTQQNYVNINDLHKQGWTILEIAEATGWLRTTVSNYLKNGPPPATRATEATVMTEHWQARIESMLGSWPRLQSVSIHNKEGLNHYLNQLEPVTKDIALLTDGVAIMSMQRSKGLTFRGAVVMGVEDGVIPSPKADDPEEERRLLYVAMTRAKEYLYMTMATKRTGPTARTGDPNVGQSRGRCRFFSATGIDP